MSRNNNTKKPMSYGVKCVITFILAITAISTVIICAKKGVFHFVAGSVTSNDNSVAVETEAPENNEEAEEANGTSKYTVFVTAGNGGTANPSGSITVEAWDSITVSFTPDEGYSIENVMVDGQNMGAVSSYTISYIDDNHTVVATFIEGPEETEAPEENEVGGEGTQGTGNGSENESGGTNSLLPGGDYPRGILDIFGRIIGGY